MGLEKDCKLNLHGKFEKGERNLITDVAGVKVAHVTLQSEDHNINTGVTAILPHSGNLFREKLFAGVSVINGFGKSMGLVQVEELGTIETPIVMTNTLSIGTAATALIRYMLAQNEDIGRVKLPRILRRLAGEGVTIDVRGHGIENDAYCVLDPERIDPLMDLFSIHFGAHPYTYGSGMHYHLPTLLDQTSFPLFSYNFFRTNTEKPIFNSEDIISKVRMPGVVAAAMEANDIAGHHALVDYGRKNELEAYVVGKGSQKGPRGREERFGAKQYRLMLWPYLMQGTIGCWVWSWHDDYTRPYFPSLVKKLEVASEVVLPDLRHRRGEVAYLYGYLSGRGLPCTIMENHVDYLNWYDAIEFSGVRPDVFGERHFVREIDPKRYRLLVVPFTKYVADETYAAFKRYVLEGGTAVVTDGSLERTFTRYRETDIRAFAGIDAAGGRKVTETRRGAGKVVYVAGNPEMEELMALLKLWHVTTAVFPSASRPMAIKP